jgi:hypothetical protein
MSSIVVLTPNG